MRREFDSRYPHRMSKNFWNKLSAQGGSASGRNKPFLVLAPMHGVTDSLFRQVVVKCGRPDVFFTGFVSVDGLCSKKGRSEALARLKFTKKEKPIIAQVFGYKPENFYKAAQIIKKLGFDGIDINMGCPDALVVKNNSGAALIKDPELAVKIINETKRGAGNLPVSVKTRIGYLKDETEKWISKIIEAKPAALTVHGRTAKMGYTGEADWGSIKKAVNMTKGTGIVVIGNGDIKGVQEAEARAKETGCDGIMIGRAALRNPWIFNKSKDYVSAKERLELLRQHLKILSKQKHDERDLLHLRVYIGGYLSGFIGSKEMRIELMESKSFKEMEQIIRNLLKTL